MADGVEAPLTSDGDHLAVAAYPNDLMNATLGVGVRRLPSALDVAILAAAWEGLASAGDATSGPVVLFDPDYHASQGAGVFSFVTLDEAVAQDVAGAPVGILNGGFDLSDPADSQFGWNLLGAAAVAGGKATLVEGGLLFSDLSQVFVMQDHPSTLQFSIDSLTLSANPANPPDAFEVALLSAADGSPLAGTAAGLGLTDALLSIQPDGRVWFAAGVQVPGAGTSGQLATLSFPLSIQIDVSALAGGTAALLCFDLVSFDPGASSVTLDNVAIISGAANRPPEAFGQPLAVDEDGAASIVLTGDDGDPQVVQTLRFAVAAPPAHGDLILDPETGAATYTPHDDYSGPDRFTFTVTDDDRAGLPPNLTSEPATVSITVTPINDLPTQVAIADPAPIAEDAGWQKIKLKGITAGGCESQTVSVTATCADPQLIPNLTVVYTCPGTSGVLTYAPAPNQSGATTITVTVRDAGLDGVLGNEDDGSVWRTFNVQVTPVYDDFDLLVIGADAGCASRPYVKVLDVRTGETVSQFCAYEADYRGGVRVAVGDLNGDGAAEIITAPGRHYPPLIKVFDLAERELPEFRINAYAPDFEGGIQVAVGDVDGDGLQDVVTVATQGASEVRVFENRFDASPADPFRDVPFRKLTAFCSRCVDGATVAAADLTGDGRAELIVGSGPGMTATISVFDVAVQACKYSPIRQFPPFGREFRGGVSVATGRIDGDSTPDIIAAAGSSRGSRVRTFQGCSGELLADFLAFNVSDRDFPVRAVGKDCDADGIVDYLFAALGCDAQPNEVRRFRPDGQYVDRLLETDPAFARGMFLG